MGTAESSSAVANDVLHIESQSKLSPEEIAKALAHHNKHHSGDHSQNAPAKQGTGKKQMKSK